MFRILFAIFFGIIGGSCRKHIHSDYQLESLWLSATKNVQYREILFFYNDYCIILSKDMSNGFSFPKEKIHFRRNGITIILETTNTAGVLCRLESDGKLLKRIWGGNKGKITYYPITEEEANLLLQKYTIKNIIDSIHLLKESQIKKKPKETSID